jgi:hypothetical protein
MPQLILPKLFFFLSFSLLLTDSVSQTLKAVFEVWAGLGSLSLSLSLFISLSPYLSLSLSLSAGMREQVNVA